MLRQVGEGLGSPQLCAGGRRRVGCWGVPGCGRVAWERYVWGIGGECPTFLHADLILAGEPVVSAQVSSKHGEHERMWSHLHATCMGAW